MVQFSGYFVDKSNMSNAKTLPATDSSRLLKKALRAAFPGIKFSCRMGAGTAYGNVTVRWTDGPLVAAVDEIARAFEGEGFDGMTDSLYHKATAIEIDGETFQSGLGLILTSRNFSEALVASAVETLKAEGYTGRFEGSMECAARAVLRGCSTHVAADHHHLARA